GDGAHTNVVFSMSSDGGQHWSDPIRVNQTPAALGSGNRHAFLPAVAVADDGTVAVTYYAFRFNDAGPGLAAGFWLVHSPPGAGLTNPAAGADEVRLTDASFNLEQAPSRFGFLFLGIYGAMASAGNDFLPVWSMAHGSDPASIFFRRIMADSPL